MVNLTEKITVHNADNMAIMKPFETKARYFSDFIRSKEWFYEI